MLIPNRFNGYSPDGVRIYNKGGKGGSASNDARRMEEERQARISAAVNTINDIFNTAGREDLYNQQKQAVYDINAQDVNKQYADAERANRFGLARSGLLGGSADIDSNARLQEMTNEGLVKAAGLGDAAASDLQRADESTKQSLISMAQSGIDTGTAQQMALNNLNANAQAASGASAGSSLGGLFNDLSQAYLTNQIVNASRQGWQGMSGSNPYSVLGTNTNYGGNVSR